jgi:hypothetical protein
MSRVWGTHKNLSYLAFGSHKSIIIVGVSFLEIDFTTALLFVQFYATLNIQYEISS